MLCFQACFESSSLASSQLQAFLAVSLKAFLELLSVSVAVASLLLAWKPMNLHMGPP